MRKIAALLVISLVNVALGHYLPNTNKDDKAGPNDLQIDDLNVKYNVNKANYLPNTKRYTSGQNEIEIEDLHVKYDVNKGNYLPNTKTKRGIAGQNKRELEDDLDVKYDNIDNYNPGNEYVPAEVGFQSDEVKQENEDQDKDANEKSNDSDEKNNEGDIDDDEDFKIEDIDGYKPKDKSRDEIKGLKRMKKSIRHLNNCRGGRRMRRFGCIG